MPNLARGDRGQSTNLDSRSGGGEPPFAMARNVQLESAGMARANRRQAIFWDEDDRRCWLSTLGCNLSRYVD
jgi:hypothetical protein